MKHLLGLLFLMFFLVGCKENVDIKIEKDGEAGYAIVLHGGAGTILKENMSEEAEAAYRTALNNALEIGENILKSGGSSLDAVEQTIMFMEDSPLFNAGKGAVFAHSGKNEMDASIMFGKDQNAGAVGGVTNIKHPISAARAVMEKSEHVLLVGIGAESFAAQSGIDTVNPAYFYTERRWEGLQKILNEEENNSGENVDGKHGTVGVVALDLFGNIAAGTSTGGMTNKRFNRIGDSPIIGAGTYANNATCGVSSTGHGEFFIRYAVAYDIHAQMQYGGKSLEEAANHTILDVLPDKGGTGGIIAIDAKGNIVMPFNTTGMYRAYANDHERFIGIYKDDGKRKVPNK